MLFTGLGRSVWVNSKLFNHLHQIKAHKLEQLTGPSNTQARPGG